MGEARTDMRGSEERDMPVQGVKAAEVVDSEAEPKDLERDVEDIRDNISGIVGELERRGHELFDWRLQLRKHAFLIAAVGASCLVGFGLTLAVGAARRRRRKKPLVKARQLRDAVSRMIEHPELVAQPHPSISRKAIAAAVSAMTGVLIKDLARRMLDASESELVEPALLDAGTP